MSEHIYNRTTLPDGKKISAWNKNSSGNSLSNEVESALPGKKFRIFFSGNEITFKFDDQLTTGEITTLDAEVSVFVVANLEEYKLWKQKKIDTQTQALIGQGFLYNGKVFSLSQNSQNYWIGLYSGKEILAAQGEFPLTVNTLDDLDTYDIADTTDVTNLYGTAMSTVKAHLGSGTTLKNQVRAATTIAEVDAVVDNR